ncbi:hypothetical protein HCU66_26980 [Pseudomonas frederiksbergensis]|uniref:hypothetical protein n=1 Tax=Pseudomonas frederiksbergensis TaxID=104087 RepID=UPI0019824983|nr:hypothetical protein [Pseudomonas frederiksbergensis]MBN3865832.1 hypothetical protein [Pseudomonas frederiksbergensis]
MDTIFFAKKSISGQNAVDGAARALIDNIYPFAGKVAEFWSNTNEVTVWASQDLSSKESRALVCKFDADIVNGDHPYATDGPVRYMHYYVFKGPQMTPHPAVRDSGFVNVTFNKSEGTLELRFSLKFQSNPPGPDLDGNGTFENVRGLEHPPT